LRLIQERAVRRIGANREIELDARIITATNCDLAARVSEGCFRQDLFYRINVLPLHIPPLRDRKEDFADLVNHFLFRLAGRLGKPRQRLTAAALAKLKAHSWPGNIRELKNVTDRAAILSDAPVIDAACILFSHELGMRLHGQGGKAAPVLSDDSLKVQTMRLERALVQRALDRAPSIRQAAIGLGISHSGLIKKMRKHNLGSVIKGSNGYKGNRTV
jgi:transcriptional regulator of aroF, aroG, tyrA and aromatic amino acid transport